MRLQEKRSPDKRAKSGVTCYHYYPCHHAYIYSARKEKIQLGAKERRGEVRVMSGFEFKTKQIRELLSKVASTHVKSKDKH